MRDLNHVYAAEPALHEVRLRIRRLPLDRLQRQRQLASSRSSGTPPNSRTISSSASLNFTPVPRDGYMFGVPRGGTYTELLNSDAGIYGGGNVGNGGVVVTDAVAAHGYADSVAADAAAARRSCC